jgi:heme-degrading monooxygenase HmoA
VVISTWHSVDEWKNWEKSPEMGEMQVKMDKLLARPTKVKIYVNA